MKGVNKAIIVGNVGKDPEVRYSGSGTCVTVLSVATSESWKDKQTGEQKEKTEWHRVKLFGRVAEIAGEYVRKGSQVYLEGSLRTEEYEKDGVKRYTTFVVADQIQLLGSRRDGDEPRQERARGPARGAQSAPQRAPAQTASAFEDDDIPF